MGYVEGSFDALVCGFGEAGQGMMSFLYEFGAFPDKDKQPNQFHVTVVDNRMEAKAGEFRMNHPGLEPDRVQFIQDSVGSESFWARMEKDIKNLDYVFINIGTDNENMKHAIDILEFAFRNREDMEHFIIVVKLDKPAAYQTLIGYFNQNYGARNVIRSIGDIERTWTWNNISGADFRSDAQTFYGAYAQASHSPLTWEEREKQIMAKPISDLAKKLELHAKDSALYAAEVHQVLGHTLDDVHGHGEGIAGVGARLGHDGGIDAHQFTLLVHEGAARVTGVHSRIRLDEGLDLELTRMSLSTWKW